MRAPWFLFLGFVFAVSTMLFWSVMYPAVRIWRWNPWATQQRTWGMDMVDIWDYFFPTH